MWTIEFESFLLYFWVWFWCLWIICKLILANLKERTCILTRAAVSRLTEFIRSINNSVTGLIEGCVRFDYVFWLQFENSNNRFCLNVRNFFRTGNLQTPFNLVILRKSFLVLMYYLDIFAYFFPAFNFYFITIDNV